MQINPFVEVFVLSSRDILALYQSGSHVNELSAEEMRGAIYAQFRAMYYSHPDHVFSRRWEALLQNNSNPSASCLHSSLSSLCDQFLLMKDGAVKVNLKLFGEWQNILSRISAVPIIAAKIEQSLPVSPTQEEVYSIVEIAIGTAAFLHPYDIDLEKYIKENGANETHLHLNSTTSSDSCWYRAMMDPIIETQAFEKAYKTKNSISQLATSVDFNLTAKEFLFRLKMAKRIRDILIRECTLETKITLPMVLDIAKEKDIDRPIGEYPAWFAQQMESADVRKANIIEIAWMCLVLRGNQGVVKKSTLALFHFYLLVKMQYTQLLVQRDDAFGFEQFERLATTKLRAKAEESYYDRFLQIHGRHRDSQVAKLEARFAPLSSWKEIEKVLIKIALNYLTYLKSPPEGNESLTELLGKIEAHQNVGERSFNLSLVVHFIKAPTQPQTAPRYGALRSLLFRQADALITGLNSIVALKNWIKGVDAASNELNAGAEVFASIFRVCSRAGLKRKTYHVGEDFEHILGGIRNIDDAITLLNLKKGDRIGHGIALGIRPDFWISSVPPTLYLKRGDWMLDTLICGFLLSDTENLKTFRDQLLAEAEKQATEIFGSKIALDKLFRFSRLRGLWPGYVRDFMANGHMNGATQDWWREEENMILAAHNNEREALEIFYDWDTSGSVIEKSEEIISVSSDFCPAEIIIKLQQAVLEKLSKNEVTIETLPTSNVRISAYRHIREHHISRWLQIGKSKVENDPFVQICLGSDDPGIFSSDIVSELYHIYSILVNEHAMDKRDAFFEVEKLNSSGAQAIF
jgi:hypothetical protein